MREVIADKLTGRATAGDVTITSEGGSATMQLQQGVAKGWMKYNQVSTVVDDSFNVSSVGDDATGDFSQNHTNNMSNANYSTNITTGLSRCFGTNLEDSSGGGTPDTASTAYFETVYNSSAAVYTKIDMQSNGTVIHGDLA